MTDPRFVAPRCHARITDGERLRRHTWVCMFAEGHSGMHYSNEAWPDGCSEPVQSDEVFRWGTQVELIAEELA